MKHIFFLSGIIVLLSISCKKEGTPIEAPGFGTIKVNSSSSTPEIEASFAFQVDGITMDSIKSNDSFQKIFNLKTGQRHVTIINENGTAVYDDTVLVELKKIVELPGFMIQGQTLLVDDYDPAVLKPAPGNMLVRFITTDPSLPDLMNVKLSLRYGGDNGIEIVPLNIEVNNVSKAGFSEYAELSDPVTIAPDAYSFNYIVEGWDAVTGIQVMSAGDNNTGIIRYDVSGASYFIPDNVVTITIPAPPSGTFRIGTVLFQKQL